METRVASLSGSRRLILAAFFGVSVFISKVFVPAPIDKAFVIVQALFLALGSLLLGSLGATFVSIIGGLLTALLRAPLAPFTLAFALLYGILVDGLISVLRAKASSGDVKTGRLMAAMTISTAIVGLASYYVTVYLLKLLPKRPLLEITILVAGVISGLVGGYLTVRVWKRIRKYVHVQH